jgi:hypothetical protein
VAIYHHQVTVGFGIFISILLFSSEENKIYETRIVFCPGGCRGAGRLFKRGFHATSNV